jgi:hypothetical protein
MMGQKRCRRHGGSSPRGLAAGARRLAEQKATKSLSREGIEPIGDPVDLLRGLCAEALALKDHFAARLQALEALRYEGNTGEQLRSEVSLFERALDRSQRFLHDLAKLGLDERSVRIDEAKVVLLVAVLQRVLADPSLGLDAGRQAKATALLAAELAPE